MPTLAFLRTNAYFAVLWLEKIVPSTLSAADPYRILAINVALPSGSSLTSGELSMYVSLAPPRNTAAPLSTVIGNWDFAVTKSASAPHPPCLFFHLVRVVPLTSIELAS
ncbi:hypothetical protein D3C80_1670700 [compost metagenome]